MHCHHISKVQKVHPPCIPFSGQVPFFWKEMGTFLQGAIHDEHSREEVLTTSLNMWLQINWASGDEGAMGVIHGLNIELDIQSLFGILCTAVRIGWDPAIPPPPPRHLGSYTRAPLVSQDRRHLFVNPWCNSFRAHSFLHQVSGQIFSDDVAVYSVLPGYFLYGAISWPQHVLAICRV